MDEQKIVNFPLRLPPELHKKLQEEAEAHRRSLHSEILWRLEESVK